MPLNIIRQSTRGPAVVSLDEPEGESFAAVSEINPLTCAPAEAAAALLETAAGAPRLISWTGTLADDLFERDPMSWLPRPREAFAALCDALAPRLIERDLRILWRPHARHVIADAQTARAFLNDRPDGPFEIVFEPTALLEPEMLDAAETHLERAFEALGPLCAAAILTNVRLHESGNRLQPAPLHQGLLETDLLLRCASQWIPERTAVILLEDEIETQRRLIETSGRLASG